MGCETCEYAMCKPCLDAKTKRVTQPESLSVITEAAEDGWEAGDAEDDKERNMRVRDASERSLLGDEVVEKQHGRMENARFALEAAMMNDDEEDEEERNRRVRDA